MFILFQSSLTIYEDNVKLIGANTRLWFHKLVQIFLSNNQLFVGFQVEWVIYFSDGTVPLWIIDGYCGLF